VKESYWHSRKDLANYCKSLRVRYIKTDTYAILTVFPASCHTNCAENSPEIEVFEGKWKGVFATVNGSRYSECATCHQIGATILCSDETCSRCYHFSCASSLGWKCDENESKFFCPTHTEPSASVEMIPTTSKLKSSSTDEVVHENTHISANPLESNDVAVIESSEDESDNMQLSDIPSENQDPASLPIDIPLALIDRNYKTNGRRFVARLGRIARETVSDRWNVDFFATSTEDSSARVLTIASTIPDPFDVFEQGDIIRSINGIRVGSDGMDTLQKFFTFLSQEIEVMLEVRRFSSSSFWN
jgi:PHD-like zinc-binding domain